MTEQEKFNLIDRYFRNELSDQEQANFHSRQAGIVILPEM